MKKIPLSIGKFRPSKHHDLYALVDDADYKWLSQWSWTAIHTKRKCGGYAMRSEYGQTILMHRLIMGADEAEEVDHKDRNGLNNQRENLRKATRKQGIANRGAFKNNRTGYKGVVQLKNGKYRMTITAICDTAEEAAHIYDQCAKMLHGDFSSVNFTDNSVQN